MAGRKDTVGFSLNKSIPFLSKPVSKAERLEVLVTGTDQRAHCGGTKFKRPRWSAPNTGR
jgi:hypothetical protein